MRSVHGLVLCFPNFEAAHSTEVQSTVSTDEILLTNIYKFLNSPCVSWAMKHRIFFLGLCWDSFGITDHLLGIQLQQCVAMFRLYMDYMQSVLA